MKKVIVFSLFILCASGVFAQMRSFEDIFPNANQEIITAVYSGTGYVKSSKRTTGFSIIGRERGSGIHPQVINNVLNRNPGYLVESIYVINAASSSVNLLDIYNGLRNIRDLKGRLYDSATRGRPTPLFEEATRITSERNTNAIPDPPLARVLPDTETLFIRLKDVNFGNTFYRGDMALVSNGMRYTMTNVRSMNYLFVPVVGAGKFTAQLYIEPINEGVLIYSIAGMEMSDFFASQIHVESAISKRLAVITSWAADGIGIRR